MSNARVELDRFSRFVDSQLQVADAAALSLADYWQRWRQSQERSETLADIQAAVSELDQGLGVPLQQAAESVRQRLRQWEQRRPA